MLCGELGSGAQAEAALVGVVPVFMISGVLGRDAEIGMDRFYSTLSARSPIISVAEFSSAGVLKSIVVTNYAPNV